LLKIVSPSHVLFGTDFPYRVATDQVRAIQKMKLAGAELQGIFARNAAHLLPRLKAFT
jgi:predicted TIM-barrel fold metal-dependent hydrolase